MPHATVAAATARLLPACQTLNPKPCRPQEGYELLSDWLEAAGWPLQGAAVGRSSSAAPEGPQGAAAAPGFSPLVALALHNCLKLLRANKAGASLERASVSSYVAGGRAQGRAGHAGGHRKREVVQESLAI